MSPILWPTIALVALIWVVWVIMYVQRFRHMKANPPTEDDFKDGISAFRYFQPVEMSANNLRNLFEMPVLFFALVPLLLLTETVGDIQVLLAWTYTLLRAAHSLEHIGPNNTQRRFLFYLGSCVALAAMWTGFVIDLAIKG